MKYSIWSLTVFVFLISSAAVFSMTAGEATGPKAVIEEIFTQAKNKDIAHDAELQKSVNRHIDFSQMADRALGSKRTLLSASDRQWFEKTLTQLIVLTVYDSAPDFLNEVSIDYIEEEEGDKKASITSEVMKKADVTEVRYSLEKKGAAWRVVDVAIDDESWVESIGDEVEDIFAKEKWPGLKQRMSKRLQELKAQPKKSQ